ncbi:MAG: FHA domain-containing protein [Clostridiales bacterium]|nr:FHA domain-containing protein [Clostridiales bacterium]
MVIEKEGLYTYGVITPVKNEYFVAVEYPMICYNRPEALLPLRLREQDGETSLLYDITDGKTVLDYAEGRRLSLTDSRNFLICFKSLLRNLEELMLNPEHIKFSPDSIYKVGEHSFQWMYCPDEKNDLSDDVQQFFAWMLSEIDYGDSDTVRFVYHIYWLIRNRSLSEELLQECLDYEEIGVKEKVTSYETFFENPENRRESMPKQKVSVQEQSDIWENQKSLFSTKNMEPTEEKMTTHTSRRGIVLAEMGLVLLLCVDIVAIIFFLRGVLYQRFSSEYIRYLAGCLLLLAAFFIGIFRIHRCRTANIDSNADQNREQNANHERNHNPSAQNYVVDDSSAIVNMNGGSGISETADSLNNNNTFTSSYGSYADDRTYPYPYENEKVADIGRTYRSDRLYNEEWGTPLRKGMDVEDGTVQLDIGRMTRKAVLKNENTGELCEMHNFPFYIGNETGLNHLSIPDRTVSRQHAVIQRGEEAGTYVIADLQSTNGIWVNMEKLGQQPVILQPGCRLRFADNRYRFDIL